METLIDDKEIVIESGDLRLIVAPFGASLRGLQRRQSDGTYADIVTSYTGRAAKMGGQGDVLIPFAGRIGYGKYEFGHRTHQMVKNDVEGPSAIHGFVRTKMWASEVVGNSVIFTTSFDARANEGYPFALGITMKYTLTDDGLAVKFSIKNTGDDPAPVAAGFHPYFTVGSALIDTDTLHVPFRSYLEYDSNLIATGVVKPVEGSPLDFRTPRTIGGTVFNVCYVDPIRDADGILRIKLSHGDKNVTVWQDQTLNYAVLYSGDPMPESHRRKALAIEAMSCGSNAFNHSSWGLVALEPGETFSGTWGVTSE